MKKKLLFSAIVLIPTTILQETGIRKSKWLCELIFENVRKESFYQSPRRMHSFYLLRRLPAKGRLIESVILRVGCADT